jgi:LPXTG-motif cell wall-anchored protein
VNLRQDFGYVGSRTLGDLVWLDIDLDRNRQPAEAAVGGVELRIVYLGKNGAAGGGDDVTLHTTSSTNPTVSALTESAFGGAPRSGEPFYRVAGLVPGNYVVRLVPASLPANTTPTSDRDGGSPTVTNLRIAGSNVLDADFAVFRNRLPVPPPSGSVSSSCGSVVLVDPTSGVADPNGDVVTLVPGSIVAPAGVQVTVDASGNLRIAVGTTVSSNVVVRWQVSDGRGGTVSMAVTVTVRCDVLPVTGTEPLNWLRAAGVAIAGGLVLTLVARRRRTAG